jgi:PKD repeat protein
VNSSGCYENKPPSPKFIMTAEKAEVGDEVSFDASRASDPEGRLVSREWVLGTTQKSGKLVSHEFDNPGSKTIELTVEDAAGNTKSASRTIEIVESDDNGDDSDEDSNNDNNEESFDIIKWLEDLFEVFDI